MRPEKRQGEQRWKVRQPGLPQAMRKNGPIWAQRLGTLRHSGNQEALHLKKSQGIPPGYHRTIEMFLMCFKTMKGYTYTNNNKYVIRFYPGCLH